MALVAIIVFLIAVYLLAPLLQQHWKYRKLPGQFPLPVLGHLPDLLKLGSHTLFRAWHIKYGPVFKAWFGGSPMVVVADPELAWKVLCKFSNRGRFFSILEGEQKEVNEAGLVTARDNLAKTARAAWQPAFNARSLAGYAPLMDDCASKLCSRLDRAGESGEVVDMLAELSKMTLQVVGSTAYGVDFHTMDEDVSYNDSNSDSSARDRLQAGQELVRACRALFASNRLSTASRWLLGLVLFPQAAPLLRWLANRLPDARLRESRQARSTIIRVCKSLIARWNAQHGADQATVKDASAANTPAGPHTGSFLALLLAARDKESGAGLTDAQIVGQVSTFLLAGYETTANALSYAVYCLAGNPDAEARLVKEIDSFGRDRVPTVEDLQQFPVVEACFNEALRLYPPATATNRDCATDTVLEGYHCPGGYHIPGGTSISVSIFAIHRDPAIWQQPDDYLPERFLPGHSELGPRAANAHLPFGGGARMCVGWKFAMQEAKITLIKLYQRYHFELQPGQVPLAVVNGITMTPRHGIKVRVVRRADAATAAMAR